MAKDRSGPPPAITFVSFATPDFSQARTRFVRSLSRFGYDRPFVFEPEDEPVLRARREMPEAFSHVRGYGYWVWKPYIIEAALAATPPGGNVVYSDIGTELIGNPRRLLDVAGEHDVSTFRVGAGATQRTGTKRDAFVLLDADRPEFWNDEQICGGFLLLRNTEQARTLVRAWKDAMRDVRLVDDAPSILGQPELPGFREHRHDQAVLSILATRARLPILVDPSQWGRDSSGRAGLSPVPEGSPGGASPRFVPVDYGQLFYVHRQRNAAPLRRIGRWMKARLHGRRGAR